MSARRASGAEEKPPATTGPEERSIYLALKDVFKGPEAEIRTTKVIKDRIRKHENQTSIRALIKKYTIDGVCSTAQTLLKEGIFKSLGCAKTRFPELFEVSPAQSAKRQASEAKAARAEIDAIRRASEGPVHVSLPAIAESTIARRTMGKEVAKVDISHQKADGSRTGVSIPSLYPIYLALSTQIRILQKVQDLLEYSCFQFAQNELPEVLREQQWHCAEAVELNIWTRTLRSRMDSFPLPDVMCLKPPFNELLDSLAALRHTAVHRFQISASRTLQFLLDAESFLELLRAEDAKADIAKLRCDTQRAIDDMKRNKELLESRITHSMQNFADQRAAIEHAEQVAIEEMLEQDREHQKSIGDALDGAVKRARSEELEASSSEKGDAPETQEGSSEGSVVDDREDYGNCCSNCNSECDGRA